MRRKRLAIGLRATLAIFAVMLFLTSTWAATQEEMLHDSNPNGTDGSLANGGLILDAAGNLYGTTDQGGTHNYGMVFELTPTKGRGWTEKVLHNFNHNGTDGIYPGTGLILDAAGNLYGTTTAGGAYGPYGTVFELTPTKDEGWTEKVLHSFGNSKDGYSGSPANLILDAAGNLYGTSGGGTNDSGTVFELTPTKDGGRTEKVLHTFNKNGMEGYRPASLILDAAGNLYGTTSGGGAYGLGAAFELTPTKGGSSTEKVLHNFSPSGEGGTVAIIDAAGNLYGTSCKGGYSSGMVFELTPTKDGNWTEKMLYSFSKEGADGACPYGALIMDAAGNLYGTAGGGGTSNYGVVFELTPKADGTWTEKVLHSFNGEDGSGPTGLIIDAAGNLYGTTNEGGTHGEGTVFELTPKAGGGWTEKVLHSFYAVWFGNPPKAQSGSPTVSSGPQQPSEETAHPSKSAGIHSVDFRNFDYPFNCEESIGDEEACDLGFEKVIHVSDGEWMRGGSDEMNEILHFRIDNVIYGDLKGDGRDEAVVLVGYGGQWNWELSGIYIFAMSSTGPQLLAQLSPSDWGKGEDNNGSDFQPSEVHVSNRKLVVSFSAGGAHCCPAWGVTAELEWNGRQFTRNGNIGLGVGAQSYYLISGEAKWPELSVECTQKGNKTDHHLNFSPSAYSSFATPQEEVLGPTQARPGGQRSFNITMGGIKQATTWVPHGDTGTFTYFGGSEPERLKFIQSLLSSGSVSIEFTPFGGVPTTSVFDVSTLRDGVEKHPECATNAAPNTASALNDEGMLLYKAKKYEEAVSKFVQAAGLDPASALFANNAGFALYQLQKYEESVGWFKKAIALDANRAVAYLNLGDAYVKLQRNADAKQAYEKYLALAPASKSAADVKLKLQALAPGEHAHDFGSMPQRVRVSQEVMEGFVLKQVQPQYPPLARQANIQGQVVLQALIGKDGTIQTVHVVSGNSMLTDSALEAVRQWRYKPYFLNGEPVEVETSIKVNFPP
jgi:TonB family protein